MRQACTEAGGAAGARGRRGQARWLHHVLRRFAEELRESLGRPAMNRRILHRLASTDEADLRRLGLTPWDVREAALREVTDVAAFLNARRALRR